MASIEEKVEDYYKARLRLLGIKVFNKTDSVNKSIANALSEAASKSGGSGMNYPDIKLLLDDNHGRIIPVMIEAKGTKGKLEKLNKAGEIAGVVYFESDKTGKDGNLIHRKGDANYSAVKDFAVNGALHYGNAILDGGVYKEVIIIGVNGCSLDADGNVADPESKAYYVSEKNNRIPKHIEKLDKEWSLLAPANVPVLYEQLDRLNLTDEEIEALTKQAEATLEQKVQQIHQSLYDDSVLRTALSTNEKLYLFCGLIMAGLSTEGMRPLTIDDFPSNNSDDDNDSTIISNRVRAFLRNKKCSVDKVNMVIDLLRPVFSKTVLWKPNNGESVIKHLYHQVKTDIIPCLESKLHLDFTGKILNSLSDWVSIENDSQNDVVLTPRYVTTLMAKMARTDMDSFVWDTAMGSAGFLVSAMDIMVRDARNKISDQKELEDKISHIKNHQLLGIEILGNIYILAVLNMILMGDGSSHIINGDSHKYKLSEMRKDFENDSFPANVFLLNPPYSAKGKGFNFVEEALAQMTKGYACILIQDSAGSGQGLPYTKRILEKNTLTASIKMPAGLFGNKASVSVNIFVFKVNRPHEADDMVTFIDFSNDGYSRQNRKKSTQEVNLRNTDHAVERYAEVEAIVLGKKPKTSYYTEENGLVIKDSITLNGDDWNFNQHQKIDTVPTEADFKKTVADYLAWKVGCLMRGEGSVSNAETV